MVRPTGTKDVPSCNNRFAALDENYYDSLNRRNPTDATTTQGKPPLPPSTDGKESRTQAGNSGTADGSTADVSRIKTIWLEPRVTHTQIIQGKLKQIRDRSVSTKRKGCEHNDNPSKTARLEPTD